MIPFNLYMRAVFASASFILAGAALAWALLPPYRVYFAGYALGLIVSIINGIITLVKTVKTGDYALGLIKRRQGTGMLQRFLLAGFAGFTAMKYPHLFHWAGVLIGLVTVTLLSLILAVLYYAWQKNSAERGER